MVLTMKLQLQGLNDLFNIFDIDQVKNVIINDIVSRGIASSLSKHRHALQLEIRFKRDYLYNFKNKSYLNLIKCATSFDCISIEVDYTDESFIHLMQKFYSVCIIKSADDIIDNIRYNHILSSISSLEQFYIDNYGNELIFNCNGTYGFIVSNTINYGQIPFSKDSFVQIDKLIDDYRTTASNVGKLFLTYVLSKIKYTKDESQTIVIGKYSIVIVGDDYFIDKDKRAFDSIDNMLSVLLLDICADYEQSKLLFTEMGLL